MRVQVLDANEELKEKDMRCTELNRENERLKEKIKRISNQVDEIANEYGLLRASARDKHIFTFIPIKIFLGGHLIQEG